MRKAVIPAAGLGTRFLPATKAQPKEMLPIVDKPAIQYVVEEAVRAGIDDILIITGRGKRAIEDHFDRNFELEYFLEAKGKLDELERGRGDLRAGRHPLRPPARAARPRPRRARSPRSTSATSRSPCCSATTSWSTSVPCCAEMLDVHERVRRARSSRCMEVPPRRSRRYGCVAREPIERRRSFACRSIVEKPTPEDAPSNLAVIGRYVLTPEIFDALDSRSPASAARSSSPTRSPLLAQEQAVYAYRFECTRYDVGNPRDALRATVELATGRDDLGPEFRAWLAEFVVREKLV